MWEKDVGDPGGHPCCLGRSVRNVENLGNWVRSAVQEPVRTLSVSITLQPCTFAFSDAHGVFTGHPLALHRTVA